MNRIRFTLFLSSLWLATITCIWAQVPAKYKLVEFDAPGAGQGPSQGTIGEYIGSDGSIVGTYYDSNGTAHGYLRSAGGTFVTFDPVGSTATFPASINNSHVIVGFYFDTTSVLHGFVRSPAGKISRYDAPGAGTGADQGTIMGNINQSGEVAGYFADSNNAFHGFLITSGGEFMQFDAPGAGLGPFQGTTPIASEGLTEQGAIAGTVFDTNSVAHGFLRAPDGTFSVFDATTDAEATYGFGVNSQQTVAGIYATPEGAGLGGFLRTADGQITTVLTPEMGSPVSLGVNSINDAGVVVGYYANGNLKPAARAYVRTPNGKVTYFKAPDAGTGPNQGTYPYANNNAGEITGTYIDSVGAYHGFIVE